MVVTSLSFHSQIKLSDTHEAIMWSFGRDAIQFLV